MSKAKVKQRPRVKGCYKVQHFRAGELLGAYDVPNGIVDAGINHLLDVGFSSGSQITNWYIGLIDNASFSALANGDTMSSHAGWIENEDYDEATRQEWVANTPSGRQVTSVSVAEFTVDATVTLKGIFIVSNSTKGGTTGTLWSTAAFSTLINANPGDLLRVTYTLAG